MTTRPGDAPPLVLWLFELPGTRWGLQEARRARSGAPGLDVDVLTAVDEDETWIYVGGPRQGEEPWPDDGPRPPTGELRLPTDGPRLLAALLGVDASALPEHQIRRLEGLLTLGDADDGARQPWHYVSQADIPAETEGEFNRWFDEEHLPRIADVPGTVRARRFRTDGSPRYLAAYDLEAREVQCGSVWRAAIASPWRDRIHPEFLRPRRLMLERLV